MDFECQPKEWVLPLSVCTNSRESNFSEKFSYSSVGIVQFMVEAVWEVEEWGVVEAETWREGRGSILVRIAAILEAICNSIYKWVESPNSWAIEIK